MSFIKWRGSTHCVVNILLLLFVQVVYSSYPAYDKENVDVSQKTKIYHASKFSGVKYSAGSSCPTDEGGPLPTGQGEPTCHTPFQVVPHQEEASQLG